MFEDLELADFAFAGGTAGQELTETGHHWSTRCVMIGAALAKVNRLRRDDSVVLRSVPSAIDVSNPASREFADQAKARGSMPFWYLGTYPRSVLTMAEVRLLAKSADKAVELFTLLVADNDNEGRASLLLTGKVHATGSTWEIVNLQAIQLAS